MYRKDLTGLVFGMLTVKKYAGEKRNRNYWLCSCSCGNETTVEGGKLTGGHTKSCGCLRAIVTAKTHTTHGDARMGNVARLRRIWNGMKNRCYNSNEHSYKWYGAKGIKVCEEWQDYTNFKSWAVANGYADNLTIDRIDSNGDYTPSNCQWITRNENSARAQMLPEDIEAKARAMVKAGMTALEVSRQIGISIPTVYAICRRSGIKTDRQARKIAAMKEIVKGLCLVGAKPSIIRKAMGFDYATIRKYINEFKNEVAPAIS